eukprot:CAMPEP_0202068746 /NCGR_PEP_ID=MMETSP0964-20121228/9_1 /ASSEMBLY_ACC=CAM_ASM_000500 /TAXON_ID=4773 /ORGANISM="Schizochytrium aggregatum, Strain ATCC28209" /LENGTH=153 /DNA_ID=CAMNT_0048635465 /DNA_START=96 /DNA_END=553 /DNA_ORIENTATION=-
MEKAKVLVLRESTQWTQYDRVGGSALLGRRGLLLLLDLLQLGGGVDRLGVAKDAAAARGCRGGGAGGLLLGARLELEARARALLLGGGLGEGLLVAGAAITAAHAAAHAALLEAAAAAARGAEGLAARQVVAGALEAAAHAAAAHAAAEAAAA